MLEESTYGGNETLLERRIPGPAGTILVQRGAETNPRMVTLYQHGDDLFGHFNTDASGAEKQFTDFRAYGETHEDVGAQPGNIDRKKYLFNGGDDLSAFGMAQIGARLYDPSVGRFMQRDPVVQVSGLQPNPYGFVLDSINSSDPTGMCPTCGPPDYSSLDAWPEPGWDDTIPPPPDYHDHLPIDPRTHEPRLRPIPGTWDTINENVDAAHWAIINQWRDDEWWNPVTYAAGLYYAADQMGQAIVETAGLIGSIETEAAEAICDDPNCLLVAANSTGVPFDDAVIATFRSLRYLGSLSRTGETARTIDTIPEVTGRVASRINIARGRTRFTPVRPTTGQPVSAGFQHVLDGHFGRALGQSRSIFSISPARLRSILQRPSVARSPVTSLRGGQFQRIVDVGEVIGNTALKFGGKTTSRLKILTDRAGNLITTYPVP